MTPEQHRVFRYLEAVADRAWLEVDGDMKRLPEVVQITPPGEIDALDEFQKPATLLRLNKVALAAAAAAKTDCYSENKPSRIQTKVEKLSALLRDDDIWPVIATNMGLENASATIEKLRDGLDRSTRPRKLTAIDVGDSVAGILRDAGLPATGSETGLLAQTLEAIREASGFPTNSRETPAKLKL